jgi:hypothetical protein
MSSPDSTPYRPPPMLRGVDPKRMNWLWRLIGEAGNLDDETVHRALIAAGVSVSLSRVRGWSHRAEEADYVPLSMAELERNLRAIISTRPLIARPQPPGAPSD